MKKAKFKYNFLLFVCSPMFFLAACSVDTPTAEYNRQKQILESSETKNYLYSAWLDTVLSQKYPQEPNLDKQFGDKNSLFYKDISYFFKIWQKFHLTQDPYFSLKRLNIWSQRLTPKLSQKFRLLKAVVGKPFSSKDLDLLWELDKVTNIKNLLKEFLLVYKYFESQSSKPSLEFIPSSLREYVDTKAKDFNLIEYTLDRNPVFEWEYSSQNEADILTTTLIEVKNNKDFNSLFSLEDLKQQTIEPLNILEEKYERFGYRGLNFLDKNLEGDLSQSLHFFATHPQTTHGFVDENANKILSLQDFENSSYFFEAPLATLSPKTNKNIKEATIEDFWFTNSESSSIEYLKKRYEVVLAIPVEEDQMVVTVKVTDLSDSKKFFYYQITFNSLWKPTLSPFALNYLPSFINPQHILDKKQEEVVKLRYLARVLPTLKLTSQNKYLFSFDNTLFSSPNVKKKLTLHFLQKDGDLLKKAKLFFVNEGFTLDLKETKLDSLVKELGLIH